MNDYHIYRLKNGVRCVHHHSTLPVAHLSLTVGAGTRDELPEQHGVAHLVEHLLFKGTARRSAYRIASSLESVGGELNAFTSKEETVVHASVPADAVARAADLLCDIVFNSLFDQADLLKERDVIIDEINSYKDSPSELIFDEFEELIFDGSALGRNILGSRSDLRRVRSCDLVNFTRSNYLLAQMVFAVSSPLSVCRFEALCDRIFDVDFPAPSGAAIPRQTPAAIDRFEIVRNKKLHQSHVLLGGCAYSAKDDRRLELALLLNVLGGPTSISRLNQLLREQHALTYSVEASYSAFVDTGLWTIYFSSDSSRREQAIKLLFKELDRFSQVVFTPRQLTSHKRQFIGQLILSSENRENMMIALAKSILLYDGFEDNAVLAQKINAIEASSLRDVAAELFDRQKISQLIYQ